MKKRFFAATVFSVIFLVASIGYAEDRGEDSVFNTFFNLDVTYRTDVGLENIVEEKVECVAQCSPCVTPDGNIRAGKGSTFREISSDKHGKVVVFDFVEKDGKGEKGLAKIDTHYKLCNRIVPSYKYHRVGGIDVGALVIPFKMRSGDLYGDSTLGPYVAFKGEYISLLATLGITQVSVPDLEAGGVKTESGLSYALGVIWSVTDSFDIGLVAGADHLSGDAGEKFEYQDEVWFSFAVGYNFTTGL